MKFFNWLNSLFKKQKSSKKLDDYDFNDLKRKKQDYIDYLLDKISKSGIKSLTKKEKEFLDNINNS